MRRPKLSEVLWLVRHYYEEHAPTVHAAMWVVLLGFVLFGIDCHLSVKVSGTKVVAK